MSRQTIRLGRILGIRIDLDYTWFLVFALITWTLAAGTFPAEFPRWSPAEYWGVAAVTACLLFGSVLLHELGHSVVAMRYGVPVKRITLFLFGGVAQIATEPPSAAAEFWIAVAGPAVSACLLLVFGGLEALMAGVGPLLALTEYLAYINGALVLFNLIPGFPLDGGRVLRAVIWGSTRSLHKATLVAGNIGRFIGFLFILLGVWQALAGNLINGMWIAFIGWFLERAAVGQIQQQRLQDVLSDHRVADAMNPHYAEIFAADTLQELVDRHVLLNGRRTFIVKRGDRVSGLLTLHRVKALPPDTWSHTTVAEAMIPMDQMKRVGPETQLWAAFQEMDRDGVNQLPVMTDGQVLGMLSRDDIISALRSWRVFSTNS